jgi:hypothetical protein
MQQKVKLLTVFSILLSNASVLILKETSPPSQQRPRAKTVMNRTRNSSSSSSSSRCTKAAAEAADENVLERDEETLEKRERLQNIFA